MELKSNAMDFRPKTYKTDRSEEGSFLNGDLKITCQYCEDSSFSQKTEDKNRGVVLSRLRRHEQKCPSKEMVSSFYILGFNFSTFHISSFVLLGRESRRNLQQKAKTLAFYSCLGCHGSRYENFG
jgi:hypothetical protein